MHTTRLRMRGTILAVATAAVSLWPGPDAATMHAIGGQNQQPEIELVIGGDGGAPPRYAVPDFAAASPDAAEAARTISQVLWDDLGFEREFYLIPRDTYSSVPAARSPEQVPFAAWRELGADAVFFGTVERTGDTVRVQVRLFNVRTRQTVFAKEYTGTVANPRLYAHTIADEVHLQQRALRGVARTKLTFVSDRNRERLLGPVDNREVKEIYISDYDGANQRRITTTRQLNITPSWSPDARAVAYASYRNVTPQIFISLIYQGVLENATKGIGSNYMPVFSPDGTQDRLHVESGRQPGSLRDEPRRLRMCDGSRTIPPATVRRPGRRPAPRSPSRRIAPARPAADLPHEQRRRLQPAAPHHQRVVCRSAHLVAGTVQRDRLLSRHRRLVRHQDSRTRHGDGAADHLQRGIQRGAGLLAQR